MGTRLQLAAATPVFGWRVSLLLGCQAGELGRAGSWQESWSCAWRHQNSKVPGRSTSEEEIRGGEKLKNGEKWKNACINKLQPREMERERRVSIDQLPGFLSQGIGMDQFERGCFS